jgi:hypothetical protein
VIFITADRSGILDTNGNPNTKIPNTFFFFNLLFCRLRVFENTKSPSKSLTIFIKIGQNGHQNMYNFMLFADLKKNVRKGPLLPPIKTVFWI